MAFCVFDDRRMTRSPYFGSSSSVASAFAELVTLLSAECRRLDLRVPFFRSPPRSGLVRSIRRSADGSATVAVSVRGRDLDSVFADLVDGVIAANRLAGPDAESARSALRRCLHGQAPLASAA